MPSFWLFELNYRFYFFRPKLIQAVKLHSKRKFITIAEEMIDCGDEMCMQ